ncbi:MAG: leucyl/phenylalanyl-tRNA--protein transferase [Myxococcota bacterium]|nr:leucyl/phenylalanyl-tRNA--protein transferase [Myxococcota bacterium]
MPIYALPEEHLFPDPELADDSGLLAVGGDLHPARILMGYSIGIFPWYSEGQPILWHSPDPRFVMEPERLHVSRSLKQRMRQRPFKLTLDQAFPSVIGACADIPRPWQDGTWITKDMQDAYIHLHSLGFAHSVEAWEGEELVGGLYGVSLGSVFFGESMFALRDDASKVAFVALVHQLRAWDFELIDSQVHTEHIERFGAEEIARSDYLTRLASYLQKETRQHRWSFDGDPYPETP